MRERETLLEPYTKGNPENALRYTSTSTGNIEKALKEKGYVVNDTAIAELLTEAGYWLEQNRKELARGVSHPDRDAPFEYINKKAKAYKKRKEAVLSIDAKKKDIIGNVQTRGKA